MKRLALLALLFTGCSASPDLMPTRLTGEGDGGVEAIDSRAVTMLGGDYYLRSIITNETDAPCTYAVRLATAIIAGEVDPAGRDIHTIDIEDVAPGLYPLDVSAGCRWDVTVSH